MRTILHSDLNNCYASIECLYHPEYKNIPMAVGGDAEKRHGIILAKNMPAKAYGIQTGETLADAQKKCPFLKILPPRMSLYSEYCNAAADIYARYTDRIEAFGPDERWLDVTGSEGLFGNGMQIANEIRRRVKRELGLTVSIGVSYNKIYAKIGSDLKKPDAVTEIRPEDRETLIYPLPVENLLFVGRSTCKKLRERGVYTIGELATADLTFLKRLLGKNGESLQRAAAGLDTSEVRLLGDGEPIKTIGNSTTPLRDMETEADIRLITEALSKEVSARLRRHKLMCRGIQIHVRLKTLETAERQCRLSAPTYYAEDLCENAMRLFRQHFDLTTPVRSIGVRAIDLIDADAPQQLTMEPDAQKRDNKEKLAQVVDKINGKYGKNAISPARLYADKTLLDQGKPENKIAVFRTHDD